MVHIVVFKRAVPLLELSLTCLDSLVIFFACPSLLLALMLSLRYVFLLPPLSLMPVALPESSMHQHRDKTCACAVLDTGHKCQILLQLLMGDRKKSLYPVFR